MESLQQMPPEFLADKHMWIAGKGKDENEHANI